jgi:hypothetical protein
MEIVGMRRDLVPVAGIVLRCPGDVGRVGDAVGKMRLVGDGVDRRQRLVEQHRHECEQARQPVKAGRALSRRGRVSDWLAHWPAATMRQAAAQVTASQPAIA